MTDDDVPDVVVPDLPEPIRAFRVFLPILSEDGPGALGSLNGYRWVFEETTVQEADCYLPTPMYGYAFGLTGHKPLPIATWPKSCGDVPCRPFKNGEENPHYGHGCGFYAAKNFEELASVYLMDGKPNSYLVGEVELWGKVYEYDRGYRAQFARPVVLYDNGRPEVQELARRYGCEVLPFDRQRFRAALRKVHEAELERIRKAKAYADLADRLREASARFERRARRWIAFARFVHGAACAGCLALAAYFAQDGAPRVVPAFWTVLGATHAYCIHVWKEAIDG